MFIFFFLEVEYVYVQIFVYLKPLYYEGQKKTFIFDIKKKSSDLREKE